VVFLAVFQGDQLRAKVQKICEGLALLFVILHVVISQSLNQWLVCLAGLDIGLTLITYDINVANIL